MPELTEIQKDFRSAMVLSGQHEELARHFSGGEENAESLVYFGRQFHRVSAATELESA